MLLILLVVTRATVQKNGHLLLQFIVLFDQTVDSPEHCFDYQKKKNEKKVQFFESGNKIKDAILS